MIIGAPGQTVNSCAHQDCPIGPLWGHLEPSGVDARHVEQLHDQTRQPSALLDDSRRQGRPCWFGYRGRCG